MGTGFDHDGFYINDSGSDRGLISTLEKKKIPESLARYKGDFYEQVRLILNRAGTEAIVVEIGTRMGNWIRGLLQHYPATPTVFAIDEWPRRQKRGLLTTFPAWYKNLEPWAFRIVHPLRGSSQEWGRVWPEKLRPDVVFVDGNHRYGAVLADCQIWWPLLKRGGAMFWHDYNEHEVARATRDFIREQFGDRPGVLLPQMIKRELWGPGRIETAWLKKSDGEPPSAASLRLLDDELRLREKARERGVGD